MSLQNGFSLRGMTFGFMGEVVPCGAFVDPHSPQPPRPAGRWGANADSRFGYVALVRALTAGRLNQFLFVAHRRLASPILMAPLASRDFPALGTGGVRPGPTKAVATPLTEFHSRRDATKSAVRIQLPIARRGEGAGGSGGLQKPRREPSHPKSQSQHPLNTPQPPNET